MKHRKPYLKCLKEAKDRKTIKIINAPRMFGKSKLLTKFEKYLLKTGVKEENIIHINFTNEMYNGIIDDIYLYNVIKYRISKGKNYILLDEIQHVSKWDKAVNKINDDFDVDIYVNGSDYYFFSDEFATMIEGRNLII